MSSETLEQALARENSNLDASELQPSRKVYLCVPFREKKDAMGFGAQFDNSCNRWYVLQEQAVALMDFPLFKKWLPDNALPSAISRPIEPGVAERGETAADPRPKVVKRSLKPKDGPFKEVWEKMEKSAKELSAVQLRVLFLKEIKWVTPSKAGELWMEFEEQLCADVAGAVEGVIELDKILKPDFKELCDYVDESVRRSQASHDSRAPPSPRTAPRRLRVCTRGSDTRLLAWRVRSCCPTCRGSPSGRRWSRSWRPPPRWR